LVGTTGRKQYLMRLRTRILSLLFLSLLASVLRAQEEEEAKTEDYVVQTETKDFTREALVNQGNPQAALAQGGLFYVSNPSPTYEVDMKLLYHTPAWQPARSTLLGEDDVELEGRYQVLDQKFEVLYEGEAYDMDSERMMSIRIGDDQFVFLPDPLLRRRGRVIHQVHFQDDKYQLLEQHRAEWQDPPERNMFDTRANHRKLRRYRTLVLRMDNKYYEVRNGKDLFKLLGLPKKGRAASFAKREGLKLNRGADAAKLLAFLAE